MTEIIHMNVLLNNFLNSPYTVHFITPEGEQIDVKATEGDTMLDLAQRYDIDLECMLNNKFQGF